MINSQKIYCTSIKNINATEHRLYTHTRMCVRERVCVCKFIFILLLIIFIQTTGQFLFKIIVIYGRKLKINIFGDRFVGSPGSVINLWGLSISKKMF